MCKKQRKKKKNWILKSYFKIPQCKDNNLSYYRPTGIEGNDVVETKEAILPVKINLPVQSEDLKCSNEK